MAQGHTTPGPRGPCPVPGTGSAWPSLTRKLSVCWTVLFCGLTLSKNVLDLEL